MKTRKELIKELETVNYRVKSLSDIPNRREITSKEQEELDLLELRVSDLEKVINQKEQKNESLFKSFGKNMTLIAAIMFLLLTIYSTTSAYSFMSSNSSIEKQLIMGVTTILTFILTIGASYFYTRQIKVS